MINKEKIYSKMLDIIKETRNKTEKVFDMILCLFLVIVYITHVFINNEFISQLLGNIYWVGLAVLLINSIKEAIIKRNISNKVQEILNEEMQKTMEETFKKIFNIEEHDCESCDKKEYCDALNKELKNSMKIPGEPGIKTPTRRSKDKGAVAKNHKITKNIKRNLNN